MTTKADHNGDAPIGELVSIVIPVYNEEGNIGAMYAALLQEIDSLWERFEIIFVDDGSVDRSALLIRELRNNDPRVKLIRFSRNFGHQVAITAGIENSRGSAVIMMDADLQHPPSLIPTMLRHWKEGYDVVYTVREDCVDAGFLKRFTAKAFYSLINRIVDTRIIPNAADFRLMDRKVVDCLNGMRERNRFVRGLVAWIGFRQFPLPYVADKRFSGKTKYSFRKMLSFAADGIASFSTFPLRVSAYVGFAAAVCGIPYAMWAIYLRVFTEEAVTGWSSLIVAILFLGGTQLMSLGILGEYVGRIYEEVKDRPFYIAQERLGIDEAKASSPAPASSRGVTQRKVSHRPVAHSPHE